MPKTKLSSIERQSLSKDTLLKWYRAHNREKLRALKDEILTAHRKGANAKIERLKKIIILNTKKELRRHKKHLSEKQIEIKAEEFATKLINLAIENKGLGKLIEKYEDNNVKESSVQLVDLWIDHNPESKETPELSPKYLAYRFFKDEDYKKDAFIMLSLIEKKWDFETASNLWEKIYRKYNETPFFSERIAYMKLREFFLEDNVRNKLGFYYGTNIRSKKWIMNNGERLKMKHYKSWDPIAIDETDSPFVKKVFKKWHTGKWHVTGWWTYDETPGSYDEFTYTHYLHEAISKIKKELTDKKNYDSGIDPTDAKEISDFLDKLNKKPKFREGTMQRDLYKYFIKSGKKEYTGKWSNILNEDIVGKLYLLNKDINFSEYKFRYFPDEKKVFFVRRSDSGKDEAHFGGYIEVNKSKLTKIHILNKADLKKTLSKLANKLPEDIRSKEIKKYRIEKGSADNIEKLAVTKGICALLNSLTKVVEYRNIDADYIGSLRNSKSLKGALKVYLKKQGYKEAVANELATIRAEYVSKQIKDIIENKEEIEKYEVIKKAVEDNPNEKLRIRINSKDELSITLEKKGLLKKIKDKLKKTKEDLEEAATGAGAILKNAMKQIEKKVSKFAGPLSPLVMWFVKKVMNIEKYLTKQIKGEPTIIGSILTGVFGVKLGASMLGSQKVDQEKFEKIAKKIKNKQTLKKKMYFDEAITLKGYKIVIPKGEGIVPGQEFDVDLSGKGTIPIKPEKKKFRIFGGSEKFQHDEHEITINNKTKIPKGTVIPKGSKIYKV